MKQLNVDNIGSFSNIEMDLTSRINLLVGDNATGKTQILKLLYFCCQNFERINNNPKLVGLTEIFGSRPIDLIHNNSNQNAQINLLFGDGDKFKSVYIPGDTQLNMSNGKQAKVVAGGMFMNIPASHEHVCTFIPEKDMLSHSKGLLSMAEKFGTNLPFSKPLIDIVEKAQAWSLKAVPVLGASILPMIENVIDGKVLLIDDRFFIQKNSGREIEFSLESEGHKKLALIWQLVMNETIKAGSILLWDEPDTNINPIHIPVLVEILLELQRNGVQIIMSTHSYIFAKYFDVRKKDSDDISFISLHHEDGTIVLEKSKCFSELKHNSIMFAFDKLLDEIYNN